MLKRGTAKLMEHLRSRQAASTMWALVGLAGPTGLQLVYMIIAARVLGVELTGNLFLIVSVALITSSFIGFGGGGLVMRDTARDGLSAAASFGRAMAMSILTFPVLLPVVIACAWYVTKGNVPVLEIFLIGSVDLLAQRTLTTSWSLFIAREEQVRASILICTMPIARIAAVALTFFFPAEGRFLAFAIMYFIISFAMVIGAIIYVKSKIGKPILSLKSFDLRGGASFSLTWLNTTLQTESDKIILGLFSNPALVAVYAVASRLMDGAAMPPRALKVSFQSKLFREGAAGHMGPYRLALKLLPITVVYGFVVWLAFWQLASLIAWVFGPDFAALIDILPILGALPLVRAISDYGAEVFLASDRPSIQAMTQTFATIMRIGFGFVLIGAYMLDGAVATALIVNAISAIILWGLAWQMSRPKKN